MINIEELKPLIVERLKPLNPDKIILFGSYAYGTPTEDSDIDLYVVTNDDLIPQNWEEKSKIARKFSKQLRDICEEYPTDLITHTKAMHKKFVEMDSMFSRDTKSKSLTPIFVKIEIDSKYQDYFVAENYRGNQNIKYKQNVLDLIGINSIFEIGK